MPSFPLVTELFKAAGYRMVHCVKDNFYMFVPPTEEQHNFGTVVMSSRAVNEMENALCFGVKEQT